MMLLLALAFGMSAQNTLPAKFSVSSTKQVYFSKGNMQFSTNNGSSWTAVFADHQYDVIGDAPGNNILYGTLSLTSYPGTVDLFGWSTPTGKQAFYGVKSSTEDADYAGDFYDWGNAFEAPWRTLSMNEWQWLLDNARWLRATVDGHKVFIIFPDVFAWDTASMGPEPTTCNAANDDYAKTITAEQWTALESAGAVLLPAGGVRVGSKVTMTDYDGHYLGYYWSSTPKTDNDNKTDAYYLTFGKNIVKATQSNPRHYGYSVRLVRNAN